jgi:hypothetical protein
METFFVAKVSDVFFMLLCFDIAFKLNHLAH